MLEINCTPQQVAAGTNDRGDVVIAGVDNSSGIAVAIVIDSATWKEVYKKMGQLSGVGIYKANRLPTTLDG